MALVYGGLSIKQDYESARNFKLVVQNGLLIKATSKLIHSLQKERGMSALVFSGAVSKKELDEFRKTVDENRKIVLDSALHISTEKDIIAHLDAFQKLIVDARERLDQAGANPADITKLYTQGIAEMIAFDVKVSTNRVAQGLELRLLSMTQLEVGKEFSGRLRANLINVLVADQPITQERVTAIGELKARVSSNIESPTLVISKPVREKLDQFLNSANWLKVIATYETVLNKSGQGGYGVSSKLFFDTITASIDDISNIINLETDNVISEINAMREHVDKSFWMSIVVVSLCVIIVIIFTLFFVRGISGSVEKAVQNLEDSSEKISESAKHISEASHQVSSSATETASSLEEIVASLEELSSMVRLNSESAAQASSISAQGRQAANNGELEMQKLISAIVDITASSKKIEEIINVIDDIAFQTNLLALNAAVEAARAGEQGRGFAVVAEAVRALAQRSAEAAKEISTLIKETVANIENGSEMATQNSVVLKEIVSSVNKISDINSEIAISSSEQSKGLTQISLAMNQIDKSTQENANASERMASSSLDLSILIQTLSQTTYELSQIVKGI